MLLVSKNSFKAVWSLEWMNGGGRARSFSPRWSVSNQLGDGLEVQQRMMIGLMGLGGWVWCVRRQEVIGASKKCMFCWSERILLGEIWSRWKVHGGHSFGPLGIGLWRKRNCRISSVTDGRWNMVGCWRDGNWWSWRFIEANLWEKSK